MSFSDVTATLIQVRNTPAGRTENASTQLDCKGSPDRNQRLRTLQGTVILYLSQRSLAKKFSTQTGACSNIQAFIGKEITPSFIGAESRPDFLLVAS